VSESKHRPGGKLYVDINQMVTKVRWRSWISRRSAQYGAARPAGAAEANVTTFSANIAQDKVNAEAPDCRCIRDLPAQRADAEGWIVSQQAWTTPSAISGSEDQADAAVAQIGWIRPASSGGAQVQQARQLDQLNQH